LPRAGVYGISFSHVPEVLGRLQIFQDFGLLLLGEEFFDSKDTRV
jgi:hypothetical protein